MACGLMLHHMLSCAGVRNCNMVSYSVCCLCFYCAQVSSDLLITLNMPVHISATSAAAEHAGAGFKAGASDARPLMLSMLSTLEIRDWGLFGES